jgi:hypothetical protein
VRHVLLFALLAVAVLAAAAPESRLVTATATAFVGGPGLP